MIHLTNTKIKNVITGELREGINATIYTDSGLVILHNQKAKEDVYMHITNVYIITKQEENEEE